LFLTSSPTCTKAALNLLGLNAGGLRLPLVEATDEELAAVRAMLERHGLLGDGDGSSRSAEGSPGAVTGPSVRAPGA
jgi:hypothetical protein